MGGVAYIYIYMYAAWHRFRGPEKYARGSYDHYLQLWLSGFPTDFFGP